MRTAFRNVLFVVILITVGQLADAFVLQSIVPFYDRRPFFDFGVFFQPASNFFIAYAGADEFLKLLRGDARELPQASGESARVKVLFTVDAQEKRPALVQAPGGNDEGAKLLVRAARWLFAQVACEFCDFFSVHAYYFIPLLDSRKNTAAIATTMAVAIRGSAGA